MHLAPVFSGIPAADPALSRYFPLSFQEVALPPFPPVQALEFPGISPEVFFLGRVLLLNARS